MITYKDYINKISLEDIRQHYDIENRTLLEASEYFNVSQTIFLRLLKYYNFHKSKESHTAQIKKSKLEKYGDANYNNQEQRAKTNIEKYGSIDNFNKIRSQSLRKTWESNHEDILSKITSTKSKNNSFNISNPEINYYNYLVDRYDIDNVKTQYTDPRYPFYCAFYIKSEDLFIELNLHWSHGEHLFTRSVEDLKILEYWKKKAETSKFYQNAIDVWTRRDPEKYNYVIKNKLNFKIIYCKGDMYE